VDDQSEKPAFDKIGQARTLAADGPQIERDDIDAMACRYSADMKADRAALERKYSAAMGELSRTYPDDLDGDAEWIAREFEEAWRDADTKLSIDGL
jgi:hypothetical protein